MKRKPWNRTYWVEPGVLLAGCYPGDPDPAVAEKKMRGLVRAKIRVIVNLQEPNETKWGRPFRPYWPLPDGMRMARFPLRDNEVPSYDQVEEVLQFLDRRIAEGLRVFVHCWGGIGRTGVIIACWLVRRHGISGEEAIRRIEGLRCDDPERHRPSPETERQREFVRRFR